MTYKRLLIENTYYNGKFSKNIKKPTELKINIYLVNKKKIYYT
jgi:hypothetical protein